MLDSVQGYVVRCPYRAGVCLPQNKSEVLAMKKQAAAILLALTLLAGCARSPAQSSPDLFDLSEPEEQSTALRMVAGAAKGTQGAYILHNSPDGNFRSILFVDAATHTAEPVCSREGCAHNDESCSAWLPGYPQSQFLFTLGGRLYIGQTREESCVWETGENGEERRLLFQLSENQTLLDAEMAADDQYLYFQVIEENMELGEYRRFLYRCDLQTGSLKRLRTMKENEDLIGTLNGQLLITQFADDITASPSDNETWLEAWRRVVVELYTVSTEGARSAEPLCSWRESEQRVAMSGSLFYQFNGVQGTLTVTDLATGEEQTVQDERLRDVYDFWIEAPAAGGAVLTMASRDQSQHWWYLYHDGELRESRYEYRGLDRDVQQNLILADLGDWYLVNRSRGQDYVLVRSQDYWADAGPEQDVPVTIVAAGE